MNPPDLVGEAGPAHARVTPYELAFPGRGFVEAAFGAIEAEAGARGSDLHDPGRFMLLGEVGRLVRDIQGDDRGAEALQRYGALTFHAFHLHRSGECLVLLEATVARYLIETEPSWGGWNGDPPAPAGYIQLPRHLFWSQQGSESPPEALDGLFWTVCSGGALWITAVSGIHPARPGFSTLPLPRIPVAEIPRWIREKVRVEGPDFATTLPGGDLDRLYSVTTVGEVLKLTARVLGYWASVPGALGKRETPVRPSDASETEVERQPSATGSPASTLPFQRLRLVT